MTTRKARSINKKLTRARTILRSLGTRRAAAYMCNQGFDLGAALYWLTRANAQAATH